MGMLLATRENELVAAMRERGKANAGRIAKLHHGFLVTLMAGSTWKIFMDD